MVERRPGLTRPLARRADPRRARSSRFPLYVTLRRLDADLAADRAAGADAAGCPAATCSRTTAWRCSAARPSYGSTRRAGRADDVDQPGQRRWSIALGKIAISLLSAFAIVYFRFPFRSFVFWMIFVTLMLPVEVRIMPDLQGGLRPRHAQHLRRPDDAADRLGHRDVPVPPVLPDRARRAGRGGAHRRRRADALLQGRAGAAVEDQHRGAVRDPVHLRLEPVPVAAAGDHRREACTRS